MFKTFFLILSLIVVSHLALLCATAKSDECPDPACCRPSRGASSCTIGIEPCWSKCTRVCPCGTAVHCGTTERYWPVCYLGDPLREEQACYTRDQACDNFLATYPSCSDPCCWDPDLLNEVCGSVCDGRE